MRQATSDLLEQCQGVLAEYGGAVTVRQLYYRLVAALVIENNLRSYKRIVGLTTKWRKDRLMDPGSFTDAAREALYRGGYSSLGAYLEGLASRYRRDLWQKQPEDAPEVWVEKQALVTVFEPICNKLQVTLQVCRGYPSVSCLYEAAHRAPDILYFGDHDPSGVDIPRQIKDDMGRYWGHRPELKVIALTRDQIEEHALPPAPTKSTDSRTWGYSREHGDECWELDALPPDVLRKLIDSAVRERIDAKLWKKQQDQWARDRERLEEIVEEERA